MSEHERLVEAVARVAYTEFHGPAIGCCEPAWGELPESFRQRMIDTQRAALAAVARELDVMGWVCVPKEATTEMLLDGHNAVRSVRLSGVSGMTIEAHTKAMCAREDVAYHSMLTAAPRSPLEG